MPSIIALRALVGASVGLGALDLVWLNVALAPQVIEAGVVPGQPRVAEAPAALEAPAAIEAPARPEATEAPAAIAPEAAIEGPPTLTITVSERVYFSTRSAVLDRAARHVLQRVVERAGPDATVALEGHADYRGGETFNRTLSKERAIVVGDHLEQLGISRSRLHVGYVGEDHAGDDEALWRDRRVEIQITGGP